MSQFLLRLKPANPTNDSSNPGHLASHSDQLSKCFNDNRDIATSRLPVAPREMAHRHFLDRHAKLGYLCENFRVNHGAHRLNLHLLKYTTIENFESTINVGSPIRLNF